MNEIVFIMGKSASGRDRIYRELSEDKALGLNKITMYTTRPLRSGEEAEGRNIILLMTIPQKGLKMRTK